MDNPNEHPLVTAKRYLLQTRKKKIIDKPDEVVIGSLTITNGQRGFIYTTFEDGVLNELSQEEAIKFLNNQSASHSAP